MIKDRILTQNLIVLSKEIAPKNYNIKGRGKFVLKIYLKMDF